jgi:hypothetical protein
MSKEKEEMTKKSLTCNPLLQSILRYLSSLGLCDPREDRLKNEARCQSGPKIRGREKKGWKKNDTERRGDPAPACGDGDGGRSLR